MTSRWWSNIRPTKIERVALISSSPKLCLTSMSIRKVFIGVPNFEVVIHPVVFCDKCELQVTETRDGDSYESLGWVLGPASPAFLRATTKTTSAPSPPRRWSLRTETRKGWSLLE